MIPSGRHLQFVSLQPVAKNSRSLNLATLKKGLPKNSDLDLEFKDYYRITEFVGPQAGKGIQSTPPL